MQNPLIQTTYRHITALETHVNQLRQQDAHFSLIDDALSLKTVLQRYLFQLQQGNTMDYGVFQEILQEVKQFLYDLDKLEPHA